MLSLGKFLVTWRYSSLLLKSLWQPQDHCPHVKDISKLKHLMRDCAFVYASFDKGTHRCRVDTNPLYEVPPSSTLSQKCLDHISENFLLPTYLLSGVNIQARIWLAPIFFLFGRHIKFQKRPVKVVVRVIICSVNASTLSRCNLRWRSASINSKQHKNCQDCPVPLFDCDVSFINVVNFAHEHKVWQLERSGRGS